MSDRRSPAEVGRRMLDQPAVREVVPHLAGESFRWIQHDFPSPVARWNYHPEVEIHLIRRGTGSYIIGDRVGAFGPGHVAVVGPQLAHDWMSDIQSGEVIVGRDALIQFTVEWLDRVIAAVPELVGARAIVAAASRGIVFSGRTARAAAARIEAVGASSGSRRIAQLCALFDTFEKAPESERHLVAHELFAAGATQEGRAAVEAGIAYIVENLTEDVRMSEAARLAHMSVSSFSKYFKNASGMTFTDLVRTLRIAAAGRMLAQSDATVASISAAAGYRNLANFNRQFLALTGMTPREYRRLDPDARPVVGTMVGTSGYRGGLL